MSTMSSFLGQVGTVFTQVIVWVGDVAQLIVETPLLLFTIGFLAAGGAIGILGRALSKH